MNKIAWALRAGRGLRNVRGWKRFTNYMLPASTDGEFCVDNDGVRFAGNIASFIDRQVFLFGEYERRSIALFLSLIDPSRRGVVLDVGANVGTHALAFSRAFQKVHSFEPNPALWGAFERNVTLNAIDNVRLHRVGLGDADAELPLYGIEKRNFGLGTFMTVEQYDMPLEKVASCRVVAADSYLEQNGITHVDAAKIDVQGFEPVVLRGLQQMLTRDRPILWVEVGSGTNIANRTELDALMPYPVKTLCITPVRGLFAHGLALQEVRDEQLPFGDYILIPK